MALDGSAITDFKNFMEKEITPAANEIASLEDKSRKHIQKLVYTNLVDRFDTMVDRSILENCRNEGFADVALKNATAAVSEADLYRLLMKSDELQSILTERLQDGLRNTVLRTRHSLKLRQLIEVLIPNADAHNAKPRVNISNGKIVVQFKQQNKKIPHSIVGYADWLYSRRNSIVHGAGTNKFLINDKRQIKKLWKIETTQTFKISVGSINTAIAFYTDVVSLLESQTTNSRA